MSIVFDSKERIARSNIYSIFGKLLRRCTQNNDNGDILLLKPGCLLWSKSIPFALTRTGLIEAIRIITISITRSTFVYPFARELSLQKKRCCVF